MSAFIVCDPTIHAIITYAFHPHRDIGAILARDRDGKAIPGAWRHLNEINKTQAGQWLLDENYRSVNCRYREANDAPIYKFQPLISPWVKPDRQRPLTAIDIIKLCRCLEYQSCEHDAWPDSWACHFLQQIISAAITCLPGYDAAPWGLYDPPKNQPAKTKRREANHACQTSTPRPNRLAR